MKLSGLLHAIHGGGRGTRYAASLMAVLLSVSLVISLQSCCELFSSLFTQYSHESSVTSDGLDHEHDSTIPVSGKVRDYCGHFVRSGVDVAKAAPAILKNSSSSGSAVFAVLSPLFFAAVPRLVSPAAYHPSPPPFRIYLRFLHLLN